MAELHATVHARGAAGGDVLAESFARTWQEQLNDAGVGSLNLQNDDPDVAGIGYAKIVTFSLDAAEVFSVLVERVERTTIAIGEEQEEVTVVSGRGLLAVFEEAIIEPALGVERAPTTDTRQFNFAAPDFDDAAWVASTATPIITAPEEARFPNAIDAVRDPGDGIWVVGTDGGVASFGFASFHGSLGGISLSAPISAIAAHGYGGYWLAGEDGAVYSFGDAAYYGGMFPTPLSGPIIAIVATGTGLGYWLIGTDGGVFAFGDATVFGWISPGAPAAGATDACFAPGGGVWVVADDGGVFAFGGAAFHGSLPPVVPNGPISAIVPHGAGGYWIVGEDSGVFAFGDAPVRNGDPDMIATEYAAGVRAVVAAEAYDPGGVDTLVLLSDDGNAFVATV